MLVNGNETDLYDLSLFVSVNPHEPRFQKIPINLSIPKVFSCPCHLTHLKHVAVINFKISTVFTKKINEIVRQNIKYIVLVIFQLSIYQKQFTKLQILFYSYFTVSCYLELWLCHSIRHNNRAPGGLG